MKKIFLTILFILPTISFGGYYYDKNVDNNIEVMSEKNLDGLKFIYNVKLSIISDFKHPRANIDLNRYYLKFIKNEKDKNNINIKFANNIKKYYDEMKKGNLYYRSKLYQNIIKLRKKLGYYQIDYNLKLYNPLLKGSKKEKIGKKIDKLLNKFDKYSFKKKVKILENLLKKIKDYKNKLNANIKKDRLIIEVIDLLIYKINLKLDEIYANK